MAAARVSRGETIDALIDLSEGHTKGLTRHIFCSRCVPVEDRAQEEIANAHGLPDMSRLGEAGEIRRPAMDHG
jgi:hypothetical protein